MVRLLKDLKPLVTWATFLGLLPIIVAILVSGYITYRYNRSVAEIREEVRHSLVITAAIDDALIDLQDLETGQRGYLITGDEDYLEPFDEGRAHFETDLKTLKSLVSDDATHAASVESIVDLSNAKLDELEETISVRRAQGFEAAQAIVRSNEGKRTMDEIRDKVSALRAAEASRLEQQTQDMRRTENQVFLVVIITVGLGIAGRLLGLFLPAWWRARRAPDG